MSRFLRVEAASCVSCVLGRSGLPRCVGYGPEDAEVAVVGINPGRNAADGVRGAFSIPALADGEDRPSGASRAFRALAEGAGLDLRRVYSTNAVKCATPGNRRPRETEVSICRSVHLEGELALLPNLRTVLLYGRAAGEAFGLSVFGLRRPVEGTGAEAVLLRHSTSVLRRWTALPTEVRRLREALSGPGPR